MSRILSRISMLTGQISSHALQVVHAQSSSDVTRSNTLSAVTVIVLVTPTGGDTTGSPVAAMTSPTLSTISRGSSGLPVACAGHTDVQRPQTVHASVSNSCFQVKSSIGGRAEGVELGLHQVGQRLHRALGAVLVAQVHVHRRRDHVPQLRGGQDHEEGDERRRSARPTSRGAHRDRSVADHPSTSGDSR